MFWRRTQFSSLRPSYFCSCTIYSQSSPSICQLTPNNCLGTRRILQKLWGDWFPCSLNFFIKHFDDSSFPWQNEGDQAKVGNYLRNTQSLDFFLSLICLFFMSTDNCPACLGSLIGAVFIGPINIPLDLKYRKVVWKPDLLSPKGLDSSRYVTKLSEKLMKSFPILKVLY